MSAATATPARISEVLLRSRLLLTPRVGRHATATSAPANAVTGADAAARRLDERGEPGEGEEEERDAGRAQEVAAVGMREPRRKDRGREESRA